MERSVHLVHKIQDPNIQYTIYYPLKTQKLAHTMTLRCCIEAQSPRAYTPSHPSTRNHSSVPRTRLFV